MFLCIYNNAETVFPTCFTRVRHPFKMGSRGANISPVSADAHGEGRQNQKEKISSFFYCCKCMLPLKAHGA